MDIYSLWLTSRLGAATVKTSALLECYGTAEALYHASPWEAAAKVGLGRAEAERLAQRDLSDIYRLADRLVSLGIGTLHPADPAYPPLLREIRTAPFTLFYKGDPHALDDRVVVAVVGTRSCTRYGAAVPRFLAEAGYKVILRPHPQSFISEKPLMEQLQRELASFPNIEWDRNPDGFASLSKLAVSVTEP